MKLFDMVSNDIINVEDIIERYEELREVEVASELDAEQDIELSGLEALLLTLRGEGGDIQYKGDWYPSTLIDSLYFVDYCQDLIEDSYQIPSDLWFLPTHINWEGIARDMRYSYSEVSIEDGNGGTWVYLYHC